MTTIRRHEPSIKTKIMSTNKHIVVIGGGFAGVEAAIALRKKKHQVTLVSNRDYFFIYPISIWIPTGNLDFEKASLSLTKLSKKHGFKLVIDEFTGVDEEQNVARFKSQTISYDYLIIASGAWKVPHKGIENTLSICGHPEQSVKIRERFNEIAKSGGDIAVGFGGNPKDQSAVRGGPAFELLFNMVHEIKKKRNHPPVSFTFFAPMAEPGKRMGEKGYQLLQKMLPGYGIKTAIGKKIKLFEKDGVVFEDDSKLKSDLTVFIPASHGPAYITDSTLPVNEAGFIKIDGTCKVHNSRNIYAAGDISAIEGPDWRAKQGHLAVVKGKIAAYNIDQEIKGGSKRKDYISHVNILCIMDTGDGAAIVYRKGSKNMVIPLPIVGHWLKKAWGVYFKLSK